MVVLKVCFEPISHRNKFQMLTFNRTDLLTSPKLKPATAFMISGKVQEPSGRMISYSLVGGSHKTSHTQIAFKYRRTAKFPYDNTWIGSSQNTHRIQLLNIGFGTHSQHQEVNLNTNDPGCLAAHTRVRCFVHLSLTYIYICFVRLTLWQRLHL